MKKTYDKKTYDRSELRGKLFEALKPWREAACELYQQQGLEPHELGSDMLQVHMALVVANMHRIRIPVDDVVEVMRAMLAEAEARETYRKEPS